MTFIQSGSYAESDVHEAILQVCSEIDKPDPPGPSARKAFYRSIIGLTDADRRRYKERLLTVDSHQVRTVAAKHLSEDMAVAVISASDPARRCQPAPWAPAPGDPSNLMVS